MATLLGYVPGSLSVEEARESEIHIRQKECYPCRSAIRLAG